MGSLEVTKPMLRRGGHSLSVCGGASTEVSNEDFIRRSRVDPLTPGPSPRNSPQGREGGVGSNQSVLSNVTFNPLTRRCAPPSPPRGRKGEREIPLGPTALSPLGERVARSAG